MGVGPGFGGAAQSAAGTGLMETALKPLNVGMDAALSPVTAWAERKRMDMLFPGTNPWERLGAPAGASAQAGAGVRNVGASAEASLHSATEIQKAKIQADAQVKTAKITANPGERQAALAERYEEYEKALKESVTEKNWADIEVARERVTKTQAETEESNARTRLIDQQTLSEQIKTAILKAQENYADKFYLAEMSKYQVESLATIVANYMRGGMSSEEFAAAMASREFQGTGRAIVQGLLGFSGLAILARTKTGKRLLDLMGYSSTEIEEMVREEEHTIMRDGDGNETGSRERSKSTWRPSRSGRGRRR